MRLRTSTVLALLLLAGCGQSQPLPTTVGELYEQLYGSLCVSLVDCDVVALSEQECTDFLVDSQCEDAENDCDEAMDMEGTTPEEWNDCLDALEVQDCAAAAEYELPAECASL